MDDSCIKERLDDGRAIRALGNGNCHRLTIWHLSPLRNRKQPADNEETTDQERDNYKCDATDEQN